MTDDELNAVLSEKEGLIAALTTERDQLRGALNLIGQAVSDVLAGYVSGNGWVTQKPDGTVVPARSFIQ